MTKTTHVRETQRYVCGKCGGPTRWGEVCIMCGATYTDTEGRLNQRQWRDLNPSLRVGHGHTCTAEGEPHKCHCGGGVSHPCNCYESPADLKPHP